MTPKEGSGRFSLLTFNAWCLRTPFGLDFAADIDERVRMIPERLAAHGADVVAMQEIWNAGVRSRLIADLRRHGYDHFAHRARTRPGLDPLEFVRGGMGNGLLVATRLRLDPTVEQLRFSRFTRLEEVFVMKGAIRVKIRLPDTGWTDLVVSHLGAVSYDQRRARFHVAESSTRLRQARELSAWLGPGSLSRTLLAVDLNASRTSPEYRLLVGPGEGRLVDCHARAGGAKGCTFGPDNPYMAAGRFGHLPAEAVDFIFASPDLGARAVRSRIVFTGTPHLSDHFGVMTWFE